MVSGIRQSIIWQISSLRTAGQPLYKLRGLHSDAALRGRAHPIPVRQRSPGP